VRNNKDLFGSISDTENLILKIPYVKSIATTSDSIHITLVNRDSLSLRYADLHGIKNGISRTISKLSLQYKAGYSEYELSYPRPQGIDTVFVKIFSKVLGEFDSDYLSNSFPIRLSDKKVIPNYRWADTIPPNY
jgi:hypothetical protein